MTLTKNFGPSQQESPHSPTDYAQVLQSARSDADRLILPWSETARAAKRSIRADSESIAVMATKGC